MSSDEHRSQPSTARDVDNRSRSQSCHYIAQPSISATPNTAQHSTALVAPTRSLSLCAVFVTRHPPHITASPFLSVSLLSCRRLFLAMSGKSFIPVRRLGGSGLYVSELGLGAMTFSTDGKGGWGTSSHAQLPLKHGLHSDAD